MKILLVGSTLKRDTEYTENTKFRPSLGLWRLKGWLDKKTNHKTEVMDPDIISLRDLFKRAEKSDLIGISSLEPTRENDLELGRKIKKFTGDKVKIVYGGINPSFIPEKYLEVGDHVVKGEGEKAVERTNFDGDIIESKPLSESEWQEATLSIPYENIPWETYWELNQETFGVSPAVALVTTNYCPRGCKFCSSTNLYKKFRMLEWWQLRDLVKRVSKLNDDLLITLQGDDELLGKAKERFFRLRDEGWKSPHPINLQTNPEELLDEEVIKCLKDVGVVQVSIGTESFSDEILEEYNKNITAEQNERVLELCLEHDMKVYSNIILKPPDWKDGSEVRYTKEKIEYWKRKGISFGVNSCVNLFPGSKYFEEYGSTAS